MVLRKPYAFFIKMFKPIHILLAIIVAYLIYLENRILLFFNTYIYSSNNVLGQNIKDKFGSSLLYLLPTIIIIFSLIILGIMFRKKKPIVFYMTNIFAYIVVIVINLYVINFLGILESNIVAIRVVKLMHDLVLISMFIELISFIFLVIRGMGINFKKFDFDSEISKFNISESDKEEFELNIDVDLNESRTRRRKKLRYLKYAYTEKKLLINSIIIGILITIIVIVFLIINLSNKYNKEGNIYNASTFSFSVDKSLVLNTDYKGNKLTDNYLVVISTRLKSFRNSNSLYLKDFSLIIGEAIFKPITKYSKSLVDIGNIYDEAILPLEFSNYLFIYEIPEKYITSDMMFSYNDAGVNIDIKLDPKELVLNDSSITKNINEEVSFEDTLGDIKFKINEYEIKDKYLINYKYCIKDDDCTDSIEYLKSSINTNFDKFILRLNLDYTDNSDLNTNSFYDFLSKFGTISYSIDNTWYNQSSNFEEIKSNKTNTGNNIYIGVNKDISLASNIKLVFNIRGSSYEYILK